MVDKIIKIFKDRQPKLMGQYRKTAVMILIDEKDDNKIIFEVRSYNLRHQPGDSALPGGKVEKGEDPKEAAIRETMEELNLNRNDFNVIGDMDYLITPYGTIIYPFIATLNTHEIEPNKDEVDHIFRVPIEFFIENEPLLYEMEIGSVNREGFPYSLIKGGKDYKFSKGKIDEYFYKYNEYVIWGFTAMIMKNFIEILKNSNK